MAEKTETYPINDYVVAARYKIIFIDFCAQQRKFEQWAAERHRGTLKRRGKPARVLSRIWRVQQFMTDELDSRIIDDLLEYLVSGLEDRDPQRFRLPHRLYQRRLEQVSVERTRNPHKRAQLPLSAEPTCLLREPNMQLGARQWECPVVQVHPTVPKHAIHLSARRGADLSRKDLGRRSVRARSSLRYLLQSASAKVDPTLSCSSSSLVTTEKIATVSGANWGPTRATLVSGHMLSNVSQSPLACTHFRASQLRRTFLTAPDIFRCTSFPQYGARFRPADFHRPTCNDMSVSRGFLYADSYRPRYEV
nr:hypothetical protein CPGR_02556 [Mycolicibacterium malmesburyense]